MSDLSARIPGLLLLTFALASPALAQDEPKHALVTYFPNPTVAWQWELTNRFAFRVDASYSFGEESVSRVVGFSSWTSSGFAEEIARERRTDTTSHTGSIGIAPILTVHRSAHSRVYVAPRISLGLTRRHLTMTESDRVTTSRTPTGETTVIVGVNRPGQPPVSTAARNSSTSTSAGVSLGASTNLHRQLSLFAEAGFTYGRSDVPSNVDLVSALGEIENTDVRRTTLNSRAVAGLLIRF